MYKSSRAFDANERVQRYRKSVSAVHENILLFKGFLGPTIKDNDALQSVGMRAARAAGVIVDSAGKLRCPPGTPNANQFTDMQMSNCLIPSAETLAAQAVNAVQRFVDGFRFKKGRLAKHKVDQKPANLGIPDADGSNVPIGAFDDSLGITNADDAVSAVADGADLSQIPDEFLMNAILKNVISGDGGGRFKEAGYGGGVHGMARFIDTKTGQMIGVKYMSFAPVTELSAEILSASVLEEFGYPASSMRAVRNMDGRIGIVTELIHNKYEGEISVGYDYDKREAGKDASVDSMTHAVLLDLVLGNTDRHGHNYLKVDDGENIVIAPIDHGNSIHNKTLPIFNEDGGLNSNTAGMQRGNLILETLNSFFERHASPDKKKDREELIQALEQSLADIREIDADALGEKLKKILQDMSDKYPPSDDKYSTQNTLDAMANGNIIPANPTGWDPTYEDTRSKSDIDALVGRIKELQSKSATEVADALFPNPDYTPQDPVSQLDSFALDLDIPTPDLADGEILSEFGEDTAGVNPFALDAEGAPLVSAREAEGLVAVTFDPEQFNIDAAEAFDSFVAEYRPSQLGDLTESDIDAIEKKMELVPTEKTTAQKIDDAIAYMLNEENGQRDIYVKMLDAETDPLKIRMIQKRLDEFDEVIEKLKTPEGAQELRKIMIKNYAQILQGIDDMQKKYPMLRGKFSLGIETPEFAIARGGYAGRRTTQDGRIYMLTEMSPTALFADSTIGAENLEDGDMLPNVARIKGTDSNQLTIAVHEALHLVHYDQTARNLGFEIGAGSPPMLDQLLSAGPNIGDSYLGLVFAKNEGIDPATPIEELKKMERVRSGQKYNDYPERFASFVNYQAIHVKNTNREDSVSVLQDLLMEGSYFDGVGEKQSLFRNLLSSMQSGRWGGNFKRPDGMETSDDVKKALSDALGQDFDSFVKELQDAVSAQFGFDFTTRSTGGVDPSEVLEVLGQTSTYGSAILNESVAEAGTLNYLLENFNGSRVIDEVKINQIKDLLEKVLPTSAEKGTTKKITAQAQQLIDKLYEAIEKLPEPEWDFDEAF
jgi:hypothetical protein